MLRTAIFYKPMKKVSSEWESLFWVTDYGKRLFGMPCSAKIHLMVVFRGMINIECSFCGP